MVNIVGPRCWITSDKNIIIARSELIFHDVLILTSSCISFLCFWKIVKKLETLVDTANNTSLMDSVTKSTDVVKRLMYYPGGFYSNNNNDLCDNVIMLICVSYSY